MAKTDTKKEKKPDEEGITRAYMRWVLTHGERPKSVFSFSDDLGMEEAEFYKYFNSFRMLEKRLWQGWFNEVMQLLRSDETYETYSVREKLLAFYFSWLQALQNDRSYVMASFGEFTSKEIDPPFLGLLKEEFKEFVNDLLAEGMETGEVADRGPLSSQYHRGLWLHFLFITKFWINDDSSDFEKSDAAIEKSVNLAFELIGKGVIHSMIDFGKFLFQSGRPV